MPPLSKKKTQKRAFLPKSVKFLDTPHHKLRTHFLHKSVYITDNQISSIMRKEVKLFALTSLLMSLCIPASSQETDIKCVADTERVLDLYFHLNDTITMPIGQAELDRVGDVLLKLPGVSMDDNGDVFIEYRYKTKVSMVYFNGDKEIKFVCPDYSLVLIPPGPLDPNIKAVTARMDGKGSRPLTPEEMREYGLIGIPVPLPEGETVESYLLKQPGVHKDEEGNIIYPNGRKLTPKDIEQRERFVHVSMQDSLLKYQQKYQQQHK